MTDPRPVHVVGDSKSNSKISKKILLYAAALTARRDDAGAERRGALESASSRGIMPEVSLVSPKSMTAVNSPTVPTSSSDAATRCATRKVASQCEDPGATFCVM